MKILKVKNIATMFSQPESWVCRHWREIGGVKIGGKIFFRLDKIEKIIVGLEDDYELHYHQRSKFFFPLH